MAPRSLHAAGKSSQQCDEEEDIYLRTYRSIVEKNKEHREERRSKLRQIHKNQTDTLRTNIQALQNHSLNKTSRGGRVMAQRKERLEALRNLLHRKNDIEKQIAHSVEGLERALSTTSSEIQVGLHFRVQSSNETAASATAEG